MLAAVVASGLLLDIAIPLGVVDGILYIALVLIAFFTKNKNFIYISAATGTLLTIAGFFISPPGGELSLSVKTISTHRTRILEKMKMKKNAELIHYAITRNLL